MSPELLQDRILIIDDDPMSRELLSFLIGAEGYAVECAESGDAALPVLRMQHEQPSVVLADMHMPGITGTRLAEQLRIVCGPETLLLAMSGSVPPEDAQKHFDGFLLKPFKITQLAAALAAHEARLPGGSSAAPHLRPNGTLLDTGVQDGVSAPAHDLTDALSPGHQTPQQVALNERIYDQLAKLMPTQQLHQMYALCINDARYRIDLLRKHAADSNVTEFVREAHSIKGGCGMLGATEIHDMSAELEAHGMETDGFDGMEEIHTLDELSIACDRLERILTSRT